MKIKMLTARTDSKRGCDPVGTVLDTDCGDIAANEAQRLIDSGQASLVSTRAKPKAAKKPAEKPAEKQEAK